MDTLRTDLEDALAHAFFNGLDHITQPVESDAAFRNRILNYQDAYDRFPWKREAMVVSGQALDIIGRRLGLVRG
jgi:hypothetical protein